MLGTTVHPDTVYVCIYEYNMYVCMRASIIEHMYKSVHTPAAWMKWKRIEEREGGKMAHLEYLRGLNQQPKATPLSGSALRLIHPYSNLHHLVDVCLSSTGSVNNNNDNRHFLLH